jgi:hypothetical protein
MRDVGGRPSRSTHVRLITLDHIDRRSYAAKRTLELIATLESEKGGSDTISEGVRQLCQRVALLSAIIEDFEARYLSGGATVSDAGQASGRLPMPGSTPRILQAG